MNARRCANRGQDDAPEFCDLAESGETSIACGNQCALLARAAPPVAPADHGNNCVDCGRALPVEAPVYRAAGGGIRCAACNTAVPEPAPAPLPPPADLVTSVLLRRAAHLMDNAHKGAISAELATIAHELRARAAVLADAAQTADVNHRNKCEKWSGPWDLLRAIGEVRS